MTAFFSTLIDSSPKRAVLTLSREPESVFQDNDSSNDHFHEENSTQSVHDRVLFDEQSGHHNKGRHSRYENRVPFVAERAGPYHLHNHIAGEAVNARKAVEGLIPVVDITHQLRQDIVAYNRRTRNHRLENRVNQATEKRADRVD
jgi:hypothetical protein